MIQSALASFAKNLSITSSSSYPLTPKQIKTDLLSGLTVALALVPEAVAFAFVAGVNPLVGLYAAFLMGLITALIGGRPGMISGATGAIAVVLVSLVADHGVEYLFATVVLMGLLQIFAGIFRLGKFIRLVPHPVMLGFVNGLAIVIFLAQMTQFKEPGTDHYMSGLPLMIMLALVGLTMAVVHFLPKFTSVIPAPLAGILVTAGVVIAFGIDVPRVGDMATIKGGLPQFHIPAVPMFESMDSFLATLKIIFPYALVGAAVGLIESLLTLNLVGEIKGERGGVSQECVAQGTANLVTGFFGGMGGCAMIGQSMINVKSGGRTRLAGITAAVFLLLFIVVASPLIEQIPLAALVGVMFMVVIGTFAWNSFNVMRKVPRVDAFVIVLVTVVTVFEDLAVAVVVGVIVSALAYAWQNASRIHAKTYETPEGAKVYQIQGPLFFGSVEGFLEMFDPATDPSMVIVDFGDSRVADQSALNAIESLAGKYEAQGKEIQLRHLSRDCHQLLKNAGHLMIDSDDDPDYEVATDYSVRTGVLGAGH